MKNKYFLTTAFLIVLIFGWQVAVAQVTITLPNFPKIPKIKKPKVVATPEPDTTSGDQNGNDSTTTEPKPTEPKYEPMDARLSFFLDELAKAQKDVDAYTPEDKLYLVGATSGEWMRRAISAKERTEWEEKWKSVMTPGAKKRFDDGFAALAASAAEKLPTYKASISKYGFHNAAEERMMKSVLTKIADYKIFSSGLQQSAWLIDKNDYGLPTARYKHGVIYLRDTKSDHPYCYATYVNIKQDYAGGGTYGASYARFIEDEMVGCPAGK